MTGFAKVANVPNEGLGLTAGARSACVWADGTEKGGSLKVIGKKSEAFSIRTLYKKKSADGRNGADISEKTDVPASAK